MYRAKRILVASGSRHSIPPVHNSPGVPRIIYKMTKYDTESLEFKVLSKYDVKLKDQEFNKKKYLHSKKNVLTDFFEFSLKLVPYRIRKKLFGFTLTDRIVYYKQLEKIIKKVKPDIVVTFMHIELFKMLQKSYPKAKHIYFFRSTDLENRIGLENIDYLQKNSSGFLANTKAPIDELKSLGYQQTASTIYNAVPSVTLSEIEKNNTRISYRRLFKISETDFVIGYAGRFSEEKSLLELLQVVYSLKQQNIIVKVLLAGDINNEKTPDLTYYNSLIEFIKNNLSEQVIFAGWVTNSELYKFYLAIDLPILLSKYSEGNSMFLIEALSYGKPALVTAIGGNKEIIKDGYNGFFVNNYLLKISLEEKIKELILNKEIYSVMSKNAQEYILKNHTEDIMINQFKEFITSLT